jgi:septum formation protein
MNRRLVLASASQARRRLLEGAGLRPEVVVSSVDESSVGAEDVRTLVLALAEAKAADVAARLAGEGALVVGCDSLLDLDGQALGKPAGPDEARDRWRRMRARSGRCSPGTPSSTPRTGGR